MKLTDFFENVPDIEIKSLMDDSRKKRPDSIFFCVKGLVNDGHEHIDEAIANGAIVIVHSEPLEKINPDEHVLDRVIGQRRQIPGLRRTLEQQPVLQMQPVEPVEEAPAEWR